MATLSIRSHGKMGVRANGAEIEAVLFVWGAGSMHASILLGPKSCQLAPTSAGKPVGLAIRPGVWEARGAGCAGARGRALCGHFRPATTAIGLGWAQEAMATRVPDSQERWRGWPPAP